MNHRLPESRGRIRPLIYALLYALLAFWLLSADELPAPLVQRAAAALRATDLSPTTVAFYETINLLTALLLTWIFASGTCASTLCRALVSRSSISSFALWRTTRGRLVREDEEV